MAFQQNQTCNASPSGSIEATFIKVMTWDPHSLLPSADEKAGSSPLGMRFFDLAERYVYVVVATLLLLAAVATIGHALYSAIEKIWSGSGLLIPIFSLLSDLLLVLIITEVLRTVVGFIRKREPGVKVGDLTLFLVIGAISVTRRILAIAANPSVQEAHHMASKGGGAAGQTGSTAVVQTASEIMHLKSGDFFPGHGGTGSERATDRRDHRGLSLNSTKPSRFARGGPELKITAQNDAKRRRQLTRR
jgi:uncharacterized membrane protein (DUF373 family)